VTRVRITLTRITAAVAGAGFVEFAEVLLS
jgi:hypothetical protein